MIKQMYTLEEYVNSASEEDISFTKFAEYIEKNGTILADKNIISEYLDILQQYTVTVQLTDSEMKQYKYKPNLLSYKIYNTTELSFLILMINYMESAKDFTRSQIRLIQPDIVNEILNSIYSAEKKNIDYNHIKVNL